MLTQSSNDPLLRAATQRQKRKLEGHGNQRGDSSSLGDRYGDCWKWLRYWGEFPVRDGVWFESQEPRRPVRNV